MRSKRTNFSWIKSIFTLVMILLIYNFIKGMESYTIACVLMILILAFAIRHYFNEGELYQEKFKYKTIEIKHMPRRYKKFNALKLDELRRMNPYIFEEYIATMYRKLGYSDAKATRGSSDGGKDVVMHSDTTGQLYYVECKRFGENSVVGRPIIQTLVGACYPDGAKGIVITSNRFTKEAIEEAKKSHVQLIAPAQLLSMIERAEAVDRDYEKIDVEEDYQVEKTLI